MSRSGSLSLALAAMALCAPACFAQLETNITSTNWFNRLVQVLEGTRERALATQFAPWIDSGETDPPTVVWTNFGAWVTNGAAPGFVRRDDSIERVRTNSLFEMGRGHPAFTVDPNHKWRPSQWDLTFFSKYRVLPPFRSVPAVSNAGVYIVSSNGIFTNTSIAYETNFNTAISRFRPSYTQISEIDEALYRLCSWYGTPKDGPTNIVFTLYDTNSHALRVPIGRPEFDTHSDWMTNGTIGELFGQIGIGDTNTGYFTRFPTNGWTNIVLGEISFEVVSTGTDGQGAPTFTCDWVTPTKIGTNLFLDGIGAPVLIVEDESGFSEYQQYLGSVMYLGNAVSFNLGAMSTNQAIAAAITPSLEILLGINNTTTNLIESVSVEILGTMLDRAPGQPPTNFVLVSMGETQATVFAGTRALSVPFSSVQAINPSSAPKIFTNAPSEHVGDRIRVVWKTEHPKFGKLAFPLFKSDINERFALLTNLVYTLAPTSGFVQAQNTVSNRFRGIGKSTTNWLGASNDAVLKFSLELAGGPPFDNFPIAYTAGRIETNTFFVTNYTATLTHTKAAPAAEGVYFTNTAIPRTFSFYHKAARVLEDPRLQLGNIIPANAQYDRNGSIYTQENIWFVIEVTNFSLFTTVTSETFQSEANFGAIPPFITNEPPQVGVSLSRGYQGFFPPAVTVRWFFNNATN